MHIAEVPPERRASSDRTAGVSMQSVTSVRHALFALALALMLCALPALVGGTSVARADDTSDCLDIATPRPSTDSSANIESTPVPIAGDLPIIDAMLRQHAQAISLANRALQRAQDSRIRRMALRIAESHAGEIQLLRTWRSKWYPEAAPLAQSATAPFDRLSQSCTGAAFDIAFLTLLLDDIQSEISSAQLASTTAEHGELRTFAASVLPVRTSEQHSIQSLLVELTATNSSA